MRKKFTRCTDESALRTAKAALRRFIGTRCCVSSIILSIILSLFSLLFAGAPDTLWTRTYGGENNDGGNSVLQTNDGNFIIAGSTIPSYTRWAQAYIIRTNSDGDTLWTKTYGENLGEVVSSVQQTSNGGFIIAGGTMVDSVDLDVYLIRTNSDGDSIWTRNYGGNEGEQGYSVQQTSDGGFIIAGVTKSFGAGERDVYLIRTNSNGDTLWTKTFGDSLDNYGYSIQQTKDGGFIVAGGTRSNGDPWGQIYLIRTNSDGDSIWTRNYGGNDYDVGESVQQTNDSGFIIAGYSTSFNVSVAGGDVYLIRTNSDGDTLWTRTYGRIDDDYGKSVQQTSDGGFIVVGRTFSFDYDLEIYLIRTNSDGDTLWTKTYGGTESEQGQSVQQTSDGGFIITGSTLSYGVGKQDVYLIRLDKETTGIQEEILSNSIKPNDFIISHNHGNISIHYSIPYSSSVKLEAYDIKGKLVKVITDKFMQKGSYSVRWDSKRFISGIYYLKLSTGNNTLIRKAVIVK